MPGNRKEPGCVASEHPARWACAYSRALPVLRLILPRSQLLLAHPPPRKIAGAAWNTFRMTTVVPRVEQGTQCASWPDADMGTVYSCSPPHSGHLYWYVGMALQSCRMKHTLPQDARTAKSPACWELIPPPNPGTGYPTQAGLCRGSHDQVPSCSCIAMVL